MYTTMKKDTAFLIHVFYESTFMNVIAPYVEKHVNDIDLYINFVKDKNSESFVNLVKERFPSAVVVFSENPGRDIRGYMNMLSYIYKNQKAYQNYVFIHTKTQVDGFGQRCLRYLLENTVGSTQILSRCLKEIQEGTKYGMAGSQEFLTKGFWTEEERAKTFDVLARLDVKTRDVTFIAGTMFIVRASIIDKHLRKDNSIEEFSKDFEENGIKHSGWHHAWERVFGTLVIEEGLEIYPSNQFARKDNS
jgi:hypothetical protein